MNIQTISDKLAEMAPAAKAIGLKVAELGPAVSMSAYLTFIGTHVDPLIKLGTLALIVINVWLGVRKLRGKKDPE